MSQASLLLAILKDGEKHDRDDLVKEIYGFNAGSARLAARVGDLTKKGYVVLGGAYAENRKKYWYQLLNGQEFF